MNRAGIPLRYDLVVGMEDEQQRIIERLTEGTSDLNVVSIVGMPGIGKTTIAQTVYQNPLVKHSFDILAWCCVSQIYDVKRMLLEILSQITYISDKLRCRSYDDLAQVLYKNLKGRKYLIVMDDIWTTEAWYELRRCFPDDNRGSRVLITSRRNLLFNYGSSTVSLRLLSEEESWKLLEAKVFHQERCPPELLDFGKMIAKGTKGLPLTIAILAGILAGTEKEVDNWKQVAERVSSTSVQRESSDILELSYKHLPEPLKPCFLYFGALPEDYQFPARKLILLWIAEGLIPRTENQSLEDTAYDWLMELVSRSLVIVSERRSIGRSKTCHLHDLVQDFCLLKAEEEKFLQRRYSGFCSSGRLDLTSHRFSICYRGAEDFSTFPTDPSLGSLLCFQFRYWSSRHQLCCFSSYISWLKGLKVLELGEVFIDESFFSIQLPVHLTYLSVNGSIHSIPPSITDLSNLETLIAKGDEGTIQVPESIWNMMKLRHLRIDDRASFKLPDHIGGGNSLKLENLQTLSYPFLSHGKDAEEILKALPRLRNLKCTIVQKMVSSSDFDSYPQLDFLTRLESLRVRYCGFLGTSSSEFNLPSCLKKLTMVHLPWNNISTLTRLPNLEVLKVLSGSFDNDWSMQDDEEFFRLRILKLCRLRIRKWDASRDNFPSLEKLVVERCEKLEAIPLSFGEIFTLQLIDVKWCTHSLANSVMQIQEEQLDVGNEEFKVRIYPKF